MEIENNNWLSLVGMISELKKCDELGVITASIAMGFIVIDTMASLARDEDKCRATRADFNDWVNRYLKGDSEQTYQYRGKDVYAARCAFLHSYSSDAELHRTDPDIIKFLYHDGGRHIYNLTVDSSIVIIATRSFVYDIICAVNQFMDECGRDMRLRTKVESRLSSVLQSMPYLQ
ncbi:hypothetical protein ACET9U_00900 [Aeromonas veronii]